MHCRKAAICIVKCNGEASIKIIAAGNLFMIIINYSNRLIKHEIIIPLLFHHVVPAELLLRRY